MSGMHYRRHSRSQEDEWEKRRLAAVKRLNKSNTGGKQTQPQPWTLQYYMLEWHEREGRLQPLQHAVRAHMSSHNDIPVGLKRNIKFMS